MIDSPIQNDNRRYQYSKGITTYRDEYPVILDMVSEGASVIDYGCGDGSLLQLLRDKKKCAGIGIEISPSGVETARAKGLNILEGNIDEKRDELKDRQFDFAICNVTLQMVMYPETLLSEMARTAKFQIVSIPNFANYKNRFELLFKGRMPQQLLFGYQWYSSGHIHQLSIKDFLAYCNENKFKVAKIKYVGEPKAFWKKWLLRRSPNLFAAICITLLEHQG